MALATQGAAVPSHSRPWFPQLERFGEQLGTVPTVT